jgi:hypothetical protein
MLIRLKEHRAGATVRMKSVAQFEGTLSFRLGSTDTGLGAYSGLAIR